MGLPPAIQSHTWVSNSNLCCLISLTTGIPNLIDWSPDISYNPDRAFHFSKQTTRIFLNRNELCDWFVALSDDDFSFRSLYFVHKLQTLSFKLSRLYIFRHKCLLIQYGHNNMTI